MCEEASSLTGKTYFGKGSLGTALHHVFLQLIHRRVELPDLDFTLFSGEIN